MKKHIKLIKNLGFKRVEGGTKYLNIKELPRFTRLLIWLLASNDEKSSLFKLALRIKRMYDRNGPSFTVQYLKESHRLTMKQVGGQIEICTTFPRVATRRGLPLIIPGDLRVRMETNNIGTIRAVLSLLTVYRVINCASTLKLETITAPFKGITDRFTSLELDKGFRMLSLENRLRIEENKFLIPSVKSGPNYKIAALGATLDAKAFQEDSRLLSYAETVSAVTAPSLFLLLKEEINNLESWSSSMTEELRSKVLKDLKLGKLSEKKEAAGKVRVFAITDVWTQSFLSPLHLSIFEFLKTLPMDGTFDQLKPLNALLSRGLKNFYSYDLSAATDRLPITLQEQILARIFGESFAKAWRNLLTERPWYHKGIPYLYAVGQPMGALSSWGMLALTHHMIVQVAASRVGHKRMFRDYALLGDDICIADTAVAKSYLSLMTDYGVDINLSKSLESDIGVSEFAKRLFKDEADLTPMPPKLITLLMSQFRALPTLVRDMVGRGLSVESLNLKDEARVTRPILWEIIGPLGLLPSAGLSPFLGDKTLTEDELRIVADCVSKVINRWIIRYFYQNQQSSQELIEKIGQLVWDPTNGINRDTPAFHHYMNSFIEITIEENTTQPELVEFPLTREASYENVYSFIKEAMEHFDELAPAVPDISEKPQVRPVSASSKMKFYQELNRALQDSGVNFEYLTNN
jgi:hypothetical protein